MTDNHPVIAVIGGSGLCSQDMFPVVESVLPRTPFGDPSDRISLCAFRDGEGESKLLAFLPRHGRDHILAPHAVPYRANLAALASLGVRQVIATCIAGSLRRRIRPGDFIVPDQFVDLTWGRDDPTEGPPRHLPLAEPYCPVLREAIIRPLRVAGISLHRHGTVAVIQGPRFSTMAESRWLVRQGWHLVNMTQYPEAYLAREMGMCYATVAAITDHDVGVRSRHPKVGAGSMEPMLDTFRKNVASLKRVLPDLVASVPLEPTCVCRAPFPLEYYKQGPAPDATE